MAAFTYSAINAQGLELKGELHAPDLDAAKEQLRSRGLLPQRLIEAKGQASGSGRGFKKVEAKSLQVFSRQFATLIEAGVSIVSSLAILEEQTEDKYLRPVIAEVRSDVESGSILSKALSRHPRIFNRLFVAMVEAGEASGTLDQVLDRVAVQIEKEAAIKRRVKGAMVYPIVVLIFASLVLTALLLFIVPVFVNVFKQLNGQLPTLTQWIVNASNLLRNDWFIIFPLVGLVIWGLLRGKKTEQGRQIWDRLKLRVPMKIGDVVLKVTIARFSRTLATLLGSGVDIVRSLEITGATSGNWVVEEGLAEVRMRVHEGVPIAQPLLENPVLPPMVRQMIRIGEETGEVDRMLEKVSS